MITNSSLSGQTVRAASIKTVQEHLRIEVAGYKMNSEMIFGVLFKAASERIRIEAACKDLAEVADSNTIRKQLNHCLPVEQLRQAESEMNAALACNMPSVLYQHRLEAAIDSHDKPFYGKDSELLAYCCRSQAKAGITYVFRIATAYVLYRSFRSVAQASRRSHLWRCHSSQHSFLFSLHWLTTWTTFSINFVIY